MKLHQTPFAYRAGATILHRIPAGLKLLCVIVISSAAFISVPCLAAAIILILIACIAARIRPWDLLKGSKLLIMLSFCVILLNWNQMQKGIITALRLFVPFVAAAILFTVSTMRELRLSLASLELKIKKIFGMNSTTAYISLGISLMLGFIPRFFELWETLNLACDARSCKRGLRRLYLLIPLLTERMMESAAETALALTARGLY